MSALKLAGAAAVLSLAVTGAHAADLMTTTAPAAIVEAPPMGFYAQIYGGADLAGTLLFGDGEGEDLNLGPAFGGAVGWETPEGFAVELDALHTSRQWKTVSDYSLASTSIMVDAKYSFRLTDAFDIYAGIGVGGLEYTETLQAGSTLSGWGVGYQVQLGAAVRLTGNLSAFAEYRYQNSFSAIAVTASSDDSLTAPGNLMLAGLKLGF